MFYLTYLAGELRRRLGRTLLTAFGLALGVGLVIGIIGVSQGLSDAQDRVLAPLETVGTDILVTRVAGAPTSGDRQNGQPQVQRDGGTVTFRGGSSSGAQDTAAVLDENRSVVTDLAKLGKPGEKFTRDFFLSATLLSFPQDEVEQIAKLPGVSTAVGGLVQLGSHQTGTVPEIVASIQTGGETVTQTVRPDPPTEAERQEIGKCLLARSGQMPGGPSPAPGAGPQRASDPSAIFSCLPKRLREYQAQVTTPLRTIRQVVDPPSTDIHTESYTAAGIDPASPSVGLVTTEQLTAGRWLGKAAPEEILVNSVYAGQKSLKVGSTIPINGTDFTVVGLVAPTLSGNTADIYFPLGTLQRLATKEGRVTQVLVKADSSNSVEAVAAAIRKQLPDAEVITPRGLADQVTGSLADARRLADRLGGALAGIVLVAAFAIAVLLTLSSIAKRVREIGTLRAIGWSRARVVRQLLGETLGIGMLGGVLGLVAGAAVAAVVPALVPPLTATTSGLPGIAGSQLSGLFGQATETVRTTQVQLSAPLRPSTLLLGVLFALVGGLLAGLAGGWRAARLAPAVALRDLG